MSMFSRLYYLLLTFTTFCALLLLGARMFEGIWLLEIGISFLPLVTLLLAMLFIVTFMATTLYFSQLPQESRSIRRLGIGVVLLFIFSSLILSTIQVTSALDNTVLAQERDLNKDSSNYLSIGFFNKFYYNYQHLPIIEAVANNSLDILGMAEISESSYQALKEQINLPFSYYHDCHCQFNSGDSVAVFSRFPLSDIKTDGIASTGMIEATAELSGSEKVKLLVIHPDAPMSPFYLNRRNMLLKKLDILLQNYREQKVIVMGDFNLSSWSPTFTKLLTMNPFLKDSARGYGLLSTWGPYFIRTKIDHILVSQNIAVSNFATIGIEGSDHLMIKAELRLPMNIQRFE
ncbi:MAG: endonuclease/exonuclease/phosphatase family protein [Candidatus Abawacabacteria bacterium]|nr:endonuclease/exonuclease/phosphatase family protein [Candidatus Abawacabacteria bacterium]